ncbi:hypothetical protein ACIA8G_19775 [Lentzea sp. NPDC051213]|uniref:hypothetical protein n=1 Tax=Lentzea sp. NPDC051213 TaxID=3364126 RepID=UPI00378E31A0
MATRAAFNMANGERSTGGKKGAITPNGMADKAAVARKRTSHATSSNSRVLPTPAGPATISPAPRTARRTAASSASLPTNGHPTPPG